MKMGRGPFDMDVFSDRPEFKGNRAGMRAMALIYQTVNPGWVWVFFWFIFVLFSLDATLPMLSRGRVFCMPEEKMSTVFTSNSK
jgi:hypothetical protein